MPSFIVNSIVNSLSLLSCLYYALTFWCIIVAVFYGVTELRYKEVFGFYELYTFHIRRLSAVALVSVVGATRRLDHPIPSRLGLSALPGAVRFYAIRWFGLRYHISYGFV